MLIDEGQFEQAIPYIQRAFDYLPKKSRTDWLMAMALNKLGRDKEALPYASRAYESEPENTDYRSTYAAVLAGSGDGAEARKFFEQMGAEGGNSPDIKLNYAYSFRTEGNLEKEIELLKQLIQEHPDYLPAYKNIGVSLGELGRNDETVAYWMKAAELDSSGDYEYNIGINFANRNLIQAAIPWYQKAAKKGKKEAIDLLTQNGVSW
jgi:tetratricopeptide (TPR) repeat protein